MAILDLPTIPSELKSISPYLQRADELKVKDPIIAYWCAYYAAQIGISLKIKEPSARHFLLELLTVLERMKKDIGPNDAIDEESASSAYVENFALKVFAMADNEDRKGEATRGTAKKFLAAAHFLDVLSVFSEASTAPATESTNAEKIRYAKWKAADIARAYREGRKPTPGPADALEEAMPSPQPIAPETEPTPPSPSTSGHKRTASSSTGGSQSPPSLTRTTLPPPAITNLPPSPLTSGPGTCLLPDGFAGARIGPMSPGTWSTAATPGTPGVFGFNEVEGKGSKETWVSGELQGKGDDFEIEPAAGESESSDSPGRRVRFSPSLEGGLSSVGMPLGDAEPSTGAALMEDLAAGEGDINISVVGNYPNPSLEEALLPGFVPSPIEPSAPLPPTFISVPSASSEFQSHVGPPHHPTLPPYMAPSTLPINPAGVSPPPVIIPSQQTQPHLTGDSTITPTAIELTPQIIARTQKHCRFAISALDYEDAEQARKELRAALTMLGG